MAPKKKVPQHNIKRGSAPRRNNSVSSASESSTYSRPNHSSPSTRRGKKHPSNSPSLQLLANRSDCLLAPQQAGLDSTPRSESTSTMRTSSAPLEVPVTYTPTTHRISKAMKGKRVHACDFPGCGKIFTRAEHKRRHELNHNPEASFPCNKPGCRKAFNRPDLLLRHQERHDLEVGSPSLRQIDSVSIATAPPSSMPTASIEFSHSITAAPRPNTTLPTIPFLMNPPTTEHQYASDSATAYVDFHLGSGALPLTDSSGYVTDSTASDYGRSYRNSISSTSSPFEPASFSSPMVATTMSGPWTMPPVMPSIMFEDPATGIPNSRADTSLPLSFSDVDAFEWTIIRRDLSSIPGLIRDDDGTGLFDAVRWERCLAFYWQHFHPCFPIIHRPSFFATKPSPLLAGAMVAIGSQYDDHVDARLYSLTMLETATKLLQKRDSSITTRSRLSDLQTVLLIEMLSKYCSRHAEPQVSSRFRCLYASLDQTRHGLLPNPLALFRSLRPGHKAEELHNAHRIWVEHETRRRILQACFIIDTQQALLFQQQTVLTQHLLPQLTTKDLSTTAPFPCDEVLWETSPIDEWKDRAAVFEYTDLPHATSDLKNDKQKQVDTFQFRLLLSHLSYSSAAKPEMDQYQASLLKCCKASTLLGAEISISLFIVAKLTPIRSLLAVSGESWLLGRKVETEAEFETARRSLRQWIEAGTDSAVALWHATKVLRNIVEPKDRTVGERDRPSRLRELDMLHGSWATYLTCLICWAHGLHASILEASTAVPSSAVSTTSESQSHASTSSTSSTSTAHPTLLDPAEADAEMREYLHVTDVEKPEDLRTVNLRALSRTHGLLETFRIRMIGGTLGGLMNEAERVLFRLVEGRSRLSHF